jgi:ATP-binding cassette subfamily A (ABC1) protein 3
MLTGLISPDYTSGDNGASIYGSDILTEMERIRYSMGVCPQHDVLFENLSVREHILFFAQLKGASYESANEESNSLTTMFHLEERLDHCGHELSGGQRRKLSVAIAVCGGSKFVVLDEPTAGMDPLARRELWDLLAALRKGRTMLLTTHYMDEADVLGDRVGIMSLGQMQCVGSTQFLKNTYGAGYKLIFDKVPGMTKDQLEHLTAFVQKSIPEAKQIEEDGADEQALYTLPFHTVQQFGPFFTKLDSSLSKLNVSNYGVTITSLEDVFLKVGEDHSVTPQTTNTYGIGKDRTYQSNLMSQIIGICKRKLTYCINDFITVPLVLLPTAVGITAAILYSLNVISKDNLINDMVVAAMYIGAYLGAPGLIAEFIVRERNDKLRNVLTVMGCDFRAYWIGTFLADYIIMCVPMVVLWITWFASGMSDYYAGTNGLNFFVFLLFNVHLISFSYFFSFIFTSPKSCIALMPIVIIMLIMTPNIVLLIVINIAIAAGQSISQGVQGGILLWGIMMLSPHGALISALLNTTQNFSKYISSFPPIGAVIAFMIVESALFLAYAYKTDAETVAVMQPQEDPNFDPACLENLDEDVAEERQRTLASKNTGTEPLRIERLRKVFPPKRAGARSVVATQDVAFAVESGEIFGLLGANGAGKTTTLSMLTRHLVPTSGDALITKHSILSEFSKGATHLGVVTQNNSLWDRLSVEAHLKLFARLRGVPEDLVYKVVDGTIDQLELTPHRHKLSMRLSGGMKRKLCVAIALIGDPEVVLLDEPSAGLDPVSRRNLWSVILRTMSHRAVILTTHSMDEAEALCKRIGIMVHGQLRALGTKQHLKNKFGSGFELVVKLQITDLARQIDEMNSFVNSMFPSAVLMSENGGLITYQIPREEMKMGLAFTELENNKTRLCIEDYSVAQPTLEQVRHSHHACLVCEPFDNIPTAVVVYCRCSFAR